VEIVLIKVYSEKPWRSRSTYQLIENCLKEKWRVHSINTSDPMSLFEFIRRLQWEKRKKLFVFNIAEFLDEDTKSCFLPSFLDDMNIPYLGASEKSVAIGFDKAETKRLLFENGIPTPRYFVLGNQRSEKSFDGKKIGFPLKVKPAWEGGQIGSREDSIVHDDIGLNKVIHRIFEEQDQPVLVEELVTGKEMREFSVGIIDGEPRLFMLKEIMYKPTGLEADSQRLGIIRQEEKGTKIVNDEKILSEITHLAETAFDSVEANDYGKVNIRMNDSGSFVLDINFMPGLAPDSFLPKAANQIFGLEYHKFVQKLVENSISRQK
jgi:D-alanine-D-alanine ligase